MLDRRVTHNGNEVVSKILDGEAVIINLTTGVYYSTAGTGASIWQWIEAGRSGEELAAALAASYEVDDETARRDVTRLLGELAAENLVTLDDPSPAPAPVTPPESRRPYVPPALTIYRDMRDLLALDPPMPLAGPPPTDWRGDSDPQ